MMPNKADFKDEIAELEDIGVIEVEQTRDGEQIRFTEDGLKTTKFKIGLDVDMQLFLFQIMWREYGEFENPHRKLVQIAKAMRDEVGVNILRTIEANEEKLSGIELTAEYIPEDFLQLFNP